MAVTIASFSKVNTNCRSSDRDSKLEPDVRTNNSCKLFSTRILYCFTISVC